MSSNKKGGSWWDRQDWSAAGKRRTAERAEDVFKEQEKAMKEAYKALDPASAEAKERKKQIDLLNRRRRRSGTIITSPLGLSGEPTTTTPTLGGN